MNRIFSQMGLPLTFDDDADGNLVISGRIDDKNQTTVAAIDHGRWQLANTTDRVWNFHATDNALEVENGDGRIVLQVVMLWTKVRFQAEHWYPKAPGHGIRIVGLSNGGAFTPFILTKDENPDEPSIVPIFDSFGVLMPIQDPDAPLASDQSVCVGMLVFAVLVLSVPLALACRLTLRRFIAR